jgi:hypothetical protein
MRYSADYFIWLLYFLIAFHLILASCKIEDEHGTPKFVAGLGDFDSKHGQLLGEFIVQSDFYINDRYRELYFLGCITNSEWCEETALISLNYESGVFKTLLNGQVSIPEKQPFGSKVFFFKHIYSANKVEIYELDVPTQEYQLLWSEDGSIDPYQVSINQEYAFFNRDYEFSKVYKRDFNGHEETLDIAGEVLYAIPNTSQILLRDINDYKAFIYDYESYDIIFKSPVDYYFYKVYSNGTDVFYLNDYNYRSIANLKTNEIVIESLNNQYLADFNPYCLKAIFIETTQIHSAPLYQMHQTELSIIDIDGYKSFTPVILYDDYIEFTRILNDGNTVIYSSMGKMYKTSIE